MIKEKLNKIALNFVIKTQNYILFSKSKLKSYFAVNPKG